MRARVLLTTMLLAVLASISVPGSLQSVHAARTKPGTVFVRGIAVRVASHGFVLRTAHHGDYSVITQHATQILEKGRSGNLQIHDGDHVGVSGHVTGRTIRAVRIRIYPTKPKPYTVIGTIAGLHGNTLAVTSGGKITSVHLTSQTQIRVGQAPATVRDLKVGTRVRLRLIASNGLVTALSVYIYVQHPPQIHVHFVGTIVASISGSITVAVGHTRYQVGVNSQTSIRFGGQTVGAGELKVGATITVYACCAGHALVATSILIHQTPTKRPTVVVRGYVVSIGHGLIEIAAVNGTQTVELAAQTRYEVGSAPVAANGVRIGDEVSIRAYRSGTSLIAERVHVYAASRRPRTVSGVVVAVSASGIVIQSSAGKRYTLRLAPHASVILGGKAVSASALARGDKVRARGTLGAGNVLLATSIGATRAPPKIVTVRGTVVAIDSGGLVIADAAGTRHRVRLGRGVRTQLHGKPAPAAALFIGVKASARGEVLGGTLVASSLTLTVTSRTVSGRISVAAKSSLTIAERGSQREHVDIPAGLPAYDGKRKLTAGSLRAGVYVRIAGYEESSTSLRATRIDVEHPALDIAAVIVAGGQTVTVQTTAGERYQLRFVAASEITASRLDVTLRPADLPAGAHVHVQGTVDSAGMLVVETLVVRLPSVTIRGRLTVNGVQVWSVQINDAAVSVRLTAATPITQGSHVLAVNDVVSGDDVTVYGYTLGSGTVIARKVLVHRKLIGIDGTVAKIYAGDPIAAAGFDLQSADGPHRVITSVATVVSGTALAVTVGARVHVTGYVRGDGVILATRVRIGK